MLSNHLMTFIKSEHWVDINLNQIDFINKSIPENPKISILNTPDGSCIYRVESDSRNKLFDISKFLSTKGNFSTSKLSDKSVYFFLYYLNDKGELNEDGGVLILNVSYIISKKNVKQTVLIEKKFIKPLSKTVQQKILDSILVKSLGNISKLNLNYLFDRSGLTEQFIEHVLGISDTKEYAGLVHFVEMFGKTETEIFTQEELIRYSLNFANRFIILFLITEGGLIREKQGNECYKIKLTSEKGNYHNLTSLLTKSDISDIENIFCLLNQSDNNDPYSVIDIKIKDDSFKHIDSITLMLPFIDSDIMKPFDFLKTKKKSNNSEEKEGSFLKTLFDKLKNKEHRQTFNKFIDFLASFTWSVSENKEEATMLGLDPEILSALYEKVSIFFDAYERNKPTAKGVSAAKDKAKDILKQFISNKKFGVYYTPKLITNYMVINSLYPWLGEQIDKNWEDYFDFEEWGKNANQGELNVLALKIKQIKSLDPAVGSGAFLVEIAEELFRINKYLTPSINAIDLSKDIVEHNLYGVDLLPGAISICKLRMWLWILTKASMEFKLNEISDDEGDVLLNKDIYAELTSNLLLPGIEYNFRCGNSLVGFDSLPSSEIITNTRKAKLEKNLGTSNLKEIIAKKILLTNKFRDSNIEAEERVLLHKTNDLLLELLNEKLFYEFAEIKEKKKIKTSVTYEELVQMKPFHWIVEFPEAYFDTKGNQLKEDAKGFNIVLGNPPYGKLKNWKIEKNEKDKLSAVYKSLFHKIGANVDMYKMFLERSINLVSTSGYYSFLKPIMFWGDSESYQLRLEYFKYNIKSILHFTPTSTSILFNNTISYEVSIFIIKKTFLQEHPSNKNTLFEQKNEGLGFDYNIRLHSRIAPVNSKVIINDKNSVNISKSYVFQNSLLARIPLFSDFNYEKDILEHLQNFKKFGNYLSGESLGYIMVGKLDESLNKDYFSSKRTNELCVASNFIKDWYLDLHPNNEEKRWIKNAKEFRKKKINIDIKGCNKIDDLLKLGPKLIGREMVNRNEIRKLHFTLTFDDNIFTNGVRAIILKDRDINWNKSFLAIFNSNLINWYFKVYSLTYHVKPYEIDDFPIIELDNSIVYLLSCLSDLMLYSIAFERNYKLSSEYSDTIFRVLNGVIYELYFSEKIYGSKKNPLILELSALMKSEKFPAFEKWSKLFWVKQLNSKLTPSEEKELKKIESSINSITKRLCSVFIIKTSILDNLLIISNSEWVKIIEESCNKRISETELDELNVDSDDESD